MHVLNKVLALLVAALSSVAVAATTYTGTVELAPGETLPDEIVTEGAVLKIASNPSGLRTVALPPVRFKGALRLEYDPKDVKVTFPSRASTTPRFLRANGAVATVTDDGEVKPLADVGTSAATDWGKYPEKWIYVSKSFAGSNLEAWETVSNVIETAAAAGYTAIVPTGLDNIYCYDPSMFRRLGDVIDLCDRRGIEIIPIVWSMGRGWLGRARLNGVEAYPVENVPFVVSEGRATVDPAESEDVSDGSMEKGDENWILSVSSGTGLRGKGVFDTSTAHSGTYSAKFWLDMINSSSGKRAARAISRNPVPVKAGRRYQVSAWFKQDGMTSKDALGVFVNDASNNNLLACKYFSAPEDGSWGCNTVFFTAERDMSVTLAAGALNAGVDDPGYFWIDDVLIRNITHQRGVVRREGLRFTVTNAETGAAYEEGVDYVANMNAPAASPTSEANPIRDSEITEATTELALVLPAGSAIAEGDRLLVTYNAPFPWTGMGGNKDGQFGTCMSNPGLYEEVRNSAEAIFARIAPRRWFLNLDEIRSGGTCDKCLEHESMAEILSGCINRMYGIIRTIDPGADVVVWDDMLSPYANAQEQYVDCRGSFVGVWNMIPKDILIMDWNISGSRDNPNIHLKESEDFFRGLGFRTLNAGFYDVPDSESVQFFTRDQVGIMNTIPGALGFMYCTWKNPPHYEFLGEYSQIIDEVGKPSFLTCTWTGGADGDWEDAANWDNPPEPRAVVRIPEGCTVTIGGGSVGILPRLKELDLRGRLVDENGQDIPFGREEPAEEGGVRFFVDATNGDNAWDGTSAVHVDGTLVGPKKTVQAAVDLAVAGTNTIVTLAPGVYAEGGTVDTARVVVTKNDVTVRSSTGRPEDVAIVGAFGAGENRTGTGATRCFAISGATNVVVRGITFRNGASSGNGGGLCGTSAGTALTLVDCVVSNCVANMGGGAFGVIAHSSRFTANTVKTAAAGAAVLYGRLANCLVDNNNGYPLNYTYAAVNCTIADNNGKVGSDAPGTGAGLFANNLAFGNVYGGKEENGDASMKCFRSVLEGTPTFKSIDTDSVKGDRAAFAQVVAPIFGDFRPVAVGVCEGRGDGSYLLNVPLPAGYAYHDLEGNLVPTEGPVAAGAYQATCEQKAALVTFNDNNARKDMEVDGALRQPRNGKDWIVPTAWPVTYRVRSALGRDAFAIVTREIDGAATNSVLRFTQPDGWLAFTPNPDLGLTYELATQRASAHYYVDGTRGDDGNDGLSPELTPTNKPLKTVQAAVDKIGGGVGIVHVAPGEYAEGAQSNCRVLVTKGYVLIDSAEPGGAVIKGDASTRCVGVSTPPAFCLRGFKLTGGHASGSGGGFYSEKADAYVLDCTITDNTAGKGAGTYGGTIVRSRIVGNHATSIFGTAAYGSTLVSCIVAGNDSTAGTGAVTLVDSVAYDCTVDGNGCAARAKSGVTSEAYGCIFANCSAAEYPSYGDAGSIKLGLADCWFADPSAYDYRVGVLSPAVRHVTADDLAAFPDYWKYLSSDVDGRLPAYSADGSRTCGAVWNVPLAMVVTCGSSDGSGAETNLVTSAGQEVTVTATDAATRPFRGFVVNGVTNLTTETSWTFTPSAEPGTLNTANALYGGDWFVDASRPDDSGNGWSWETAFRTLAKAAGKARSGDTIRVAPGTYGEGKMLYDRARFAGSTPTIRSRVWVKNGVTLVSEAGAGRTVIRGASATDPDAYGNGPDALRCVALDANAKVVGFTLTGGRTAKEGASTTDDACGGAVIGGDYMSSEVVDCIVSNNCAFGAGGALEYCRCIRSRILDCYANTASVGHNASFNSCVIDHCHNLQSGGGDCAVMQYREFDSCTVGTDITRLTDDLRIYVFGNPRGGIVNSLVLNERVLATSVGSKAYATNCVFVGKFESDADTYELVDCIRTNLEAAVVDANLRPVAGSCVGIDGANDAISAAEALAATDLTGFPRVTNGARDIGALEANWYPRYGRDIGRRVKVTDAAWNVIEQDGKVTIPGGAAIAFDVTNSGSNAIDGVLNVTVNGGGTLSVTLDGAPVAFDDPSAIRLTVEPGVHKVVVSLAGGATVSAVIESLKSQIGSIIILR